MLRWLDSLLDRLLRLAERNKLLRQIARRVMLIPIVKRELKQVCHFYGIVLFEKELDTLRRSYGIHPRVEIASDHAINVEISEKNLTDIKRILDRAGIRFWLMFGTFLGAYRDQALIPYDEDTDLAIYFEDLPRLVSCQDMFAIEGFYLGVDLDMATLYRDSEHTDIYLLPLDGSKRVWHEIKYDVSAFETFNEVEYLGQKWRILSEPERWLRYTYGEDWRTPVKGKGVHHHAYGDKFESA